MSKPLALLTWAISVITGIILSGMLFNFSHFPDGADERVKYDFASVILAISVGFATQIGLFVSPFIIGRNIFLRILAVLLMTPFIYFFLLHDLIDLVSQFINMNAYYWQDWKLNFWSHLSSTFMILMWTGVYIYNIVLLLFVNSWSQIESADNLPT